MTDWRDRIVEVKRMRVRDIAGHPQNPKDHPKRQRDVLAASLSEVGKADVLRAYYSRKTGEPVLTLWDGHLRQNLNPDAEWWIAITDLDDAEAALMLATFDPIAALTETNAERLAGVLAEVQTGEAALQAMLAEMAAKSGLTPPIDPDEEWKGMPAFEHEDQRAYQSINVHIRDAEAAAEFARILDKKITEDTKSLWYPDDGLEPIQARYEDES